MYGVGGTPPERRVLEYSGATATVDYPALALHELGAAGWPSLAGALIAAAVLTKAQDIFIAPAVVLAIWWTGAPGRRPVRLLSPAAAGLAVSGAIVAPVVRAGGWPNMLGRLATHDRLSANAANLWWVCSRRCRCWCWPRRGAAPSRRSPSASARWWR